MLGLHYAHSPNPFGPWPPGMSHALHTARLMAGYGHQAAAWPRTRAQGATVSYLSDDFLVLIVEDI